MQCMDGDTKNEGKMEGKERELMVGSWSQCDTNVSQCVDIM